MILHKKAIRAMWGNKTAYIACIVLVGIGIMIYECLGIASHSLVAAVERYYRQCKKVDLVLEGRRANQKISGTVLFVENQAVVKISALGTEERKVKVNIVPNEQDILKDGYEVDVNFYYYQEENKLTVPKAALFRENDLDMVWAVLDGKAQKVQVQKGMELRTEFVIEDGIGENSIIIADANVSGLKDGVRVRRTNT